MLSQKLGQMAPVDPGEISEAIDAQILLFRSSEHVTAEHGP